MLSQETTRIIQATVPAVKDHAAEITAHFYPLMFSRYPKVKGFFNQTHQAKGSQPQALANALIAYAANIDNLQALGGAVNQIAQKHCSLNIRPEHYPIVGECLLESIHTVLGDAATPEVLSAWEAAYGQLANILAGTEEEIYQSNARRSGGWRGERTFIVSNKVIESETITSFYLVPQDKREVTFEFEPGQYIGLAAKIDGQVFRRNYSLSVSPGQNYLRISVKREDDGVMSNYLHNHIEEGDTINLTAPCGNFILRASKRPLFLITAGVGITPAISMLDVALANARDVFFIHATQNSRTHAFKSHVDQLALANQNLNVRYIYDQPLMQDRPDHRGFISREILEPLLPLDRDIDVYFLGPKPFMKYVNQLLAELHVPEDQIEFEFFGPLEELEG